MKKVFWLSCCILFLLPLTTLAEEATSIDTLQTVESSQPIISDASSESVTQTSSSSEDTGTQSTVTEATSETIDAASVIAAIQEETGDETDIQTFSMQEQPSEMRQGLQTGISGGSVTALTQAELDQLSDEQLAQANQLALRYSSDAMGFDIGFLGKIVRALFIDQSLSWTAIEPQLVFDPSSYSTFSAMIPDIAQLKDYLSTLYPANGIFLTINQAVSDEWLTSILTHLDTVEAQSSDETLFPGRIAWIIHAVNESLYLPETVTTESSDVDQQTTDTTVETVASSEGQSETSTTATPEQNTDRLPKTNETKSPVLLIAGIVLLLLVAIIFWRRKKK